MYECTAYTLTCQARILSARVIVSAKPPMRRAGVALFLVPLGAAEIGRRRPIGSEEMKATPQAGNFEDAAAKRVTQQRSPDHAGLRFVGTARRLASSICVNVT
jgi:hypothetical protein